MKGGTRPGKGRVAEWSKAENCKSVEVFLCRFKSCLSHLLVVDFKEEKRGIRQRRKANRAKLLWPFREVQLYRMLVREVGELLRSIDSPSISNPNEKRIAFRRPEGSHYQRARPTEVPKGPIYSISQSPKKTPSPLDSISLLTQYMWSPDIYEGSPTPVTAFLSIAPKISISTNILRLSIYGSYGATLQQIFFFCSISSVLLGALAAMAQTKVKRLLAHSSIRHVGYIRTGFSCGTIEGIQSLPIGIFIYASMTIDAFAIVSALRQSRVKYIADLCALAKMNPISAITFSITIFSYAGIPPLAGFCSKFYLFVAALGCGAYFLALEGVVTSVIGRWAAGRLPRVSQFRGPKAVLTFSIIVGKERRSPSEPSNEEQEENKAPMAREACSERAQRKGRKFGGEAAELIPFASWAQSSAVFPGQIKDLGLLCYATSL
ncbi:NADH dehydrogenase subunit 2 [Tanacetum coccineum]|uniref:NADH dehydrogenase subunit 2 n=1 Tax=Tanacetum coccineum TaxID=301880 RepID=A0ABQ4WT02_9ASTR